MNGATPIPSPKCWNFYELTHAEIVNGFSVMQVNDIRVSSRGEGMVIRVTIFSVSWTSATQEYLGDLSFPLRNYLEIVH